MSYEKTIPHLIEKERLFEWVDEGDLSKPYILSGRRIYLIGLENGEYKGRWNGVWSLPIKLIDSIRFGITSDSDRIEWLSKYCRRFISRLSHAERVYEMNHLRAEVNELQFIPEEGMSVCWRLKVTNNDGEEKMLKLVANPTVNLMWEVKQIGELWRERKELLFYDKKANSIIARHRDRSNWIAIFGANRPADTRALGIDEANNVIPQNREPNPTDPFYGNVVLTYPLTLKPHQSCELVFSLTGGSDSLYSLLNQHEFALNNFRVILQAKNNIYTELMEQTVSIECPSELICRAFSWSKVNLHMLKHLQPGFGLGYMAGLPHFPIYFGRDIAWTSLGATAVGDFEAVKESLLLLARFQASENGEDSLREPFYRGEVPHEVRTEGSIYYYSVDATPLFVIAVHNYHRWSRDDAFLQFIYKNVVNAMEWCINADRDEDGLMEHGPEGFLPDITWMDSMYRGKSAVDVQAIFCHALSCGAKIASHMQDKERASEWEHRHEELKKALMMRYWDAEFQFFYDTISPDMEPQRSKTINAVVPVLFRLTPPDISARVLERVDGEDFMTEWGVRTRSKSDPEYDPRSYQKGGVWPFCTGWVAYSDFIWDRYEYGLKNALRLANSLELGSNYFKEILYGDISPTGAPPVHPTGCFIQAWSAGLFLLAVIEGLLGVSPKDSGTLSLTPFLPDEWNRVEIRSIRTGDATIDSQISRECREVTVKILNRSPNPIRVDAGFTAPISVDIATAKEESRNLEASCTMREGYTHIFTPLDLKAHQSRTIHFTWNG